MKEDNTILDRPLRSGRDQEIKSNRHLHQSHTSLTRHRRDHSFDSRSRSRERERHHYARDRRSERKSDPHQHNHHDHRTERRPSSHHDENETRFSNRDKNTKDLHYESDRKHSNKDHHRPHHHHPHPREEERKYYRREESHFLRRHFIEEEVNPKHRISLNNDNHTASNRTSVQRQKPFPYYEVVNAPPDEKLGLIQDDPRGTDPTKRITSKASHRGHGRNTESFDPASTLVRPDMRIWIGSNRTNKYERKLKHDDVVIVPELFGKEDDWDNYYQFISEIRELQKDPQKNKGAEWISWHEGAHLISKHPEQSPTFQKVIDRLCEYFEIDKTNIGTRFNWYRDSSDWKPFHHDSAAFHPLRAKHQNITVGVSFGAQRELAFIRDREYKDGEESHHDDQNHIVKNKDANGPGTGNKCLLYFPQMNNSVFSFGRDVNILWKHGINALPPSEQDGKGRISIVLWGNAKNVIEEEGSPPLLGSDGMGPHGHQEEHRRDRRDRRSHHDRRRKEDSNSRNGRRDYHQSHNRNPSEKENKPPTDI